MSRKANGWCLGEAKPGDLGEGGKGVDESDGKVNL